MNNNYNITRDYHSLYNELISRMVSKKSERLFNVQKAFELAERLHKPQFRDSGDPYILHPVIVATILEKLDFDSDVISAALLHDVVEDCGYTIDEIKQNFNSEIAEIVDGVTAINKEKYKQELDSIFDNADFLKQSLEGKTYNKLLKIGKKNKFAFYIKFADRLHNLQTIEHVEEYRKIEKVKQTEKWILPLTEILKTSFFYYILKNECFKILNEKRGSQFFEEYARHNKNNQKNVSALRESLFNYVSNYFNKTKTRENQLAKIVFTPLTEEQIYENIVDQLQMKGLHNIKASHIIKVPTCDIYLVFKNEMTSYKAGELLFNLLEDKKIKSELEIIGFTRDEKFETDYYVVQDKHKNKFRITLLSLGKYLTLLNGSIDGTNIDLLDDEAGNEIVTEFIKVKTRSNKIMEIPAGSTVLDFAFKIHNDLGFCFQYATLNDSPSKLPHYTKLKEGDKVNIFTKKDEVTGQDMEMAQIRWLAYVKTETAKKALIRYFEKKMAKENK